MNETNKVRLHGMISKEPAYSHSAGDMKFYSAKLKVPRLSGTDDDVPLMLREKDMPGFTKELEVTVEGAIRTWNNRSGSDRTPVISVLVDTWTPESAEPANDVWLSCVLCRDPVLRHTPLGRTICDMTCASRRTSGRSDYLPMIAWGAVASALSELACGDGFRCRARFQSRAYSKALPDGTLEERTAYEIAIMRAYIPGSDRKNT